MNKWDEQLQRAVPGWQLVVQWRSTGTVIPVFIADSAYSPENADRLIRHFGDLDEQVDQFGRPPT